MNRIKFVITNGNEIVSRHYTMGGAVVKLERRKCVSDLIKAVEFVEWDGRLILRNLDNDEINELHIHSREFPCMEIA